MAGRWEPEGPDLLRRGGGEPASQAGRDREPQLGSGQPGRSAEASGPSADPQRGGCRSQPPRLSLGSGPRRRPGLPMGRKRLITDAFRVVKKKRARKRPREARSPPQVKRESHPQDTARLDQLEILKQFDLSWQYGPCTGITRLQRWERAQFLGLSPPTTVWDLLLKYNKDPFVIYSLWHEYAL